MADARYTQVAQSLVVVSEVLVTKFASRPVGGRVLEVKAPLGPSTEGGRLSRQVLALTNATSSVAIGWLDLVNAECGVKEYATLKLVAELRGLGPLDFTSDAWSTFTALLAQELAALGVRLKVDVIEAAELRTEKTLRPRGRTGGTSSTPLVVALGVLGLVAAASLAWFLLR